MQLLRWSELTVLFLCTPLLILFLVSDYDTWLMPLLILMGGYCLLLLWKDVDFKRFRLWHTDEFWRHLGATLKVFIPAAIALALVVYYFAPHILFKLPREDMQFWLITLAIYPIVSVIPQELIFRTFFFHRYKRIIPSKNHPMGAQYRELFIGSRRVRELDCSRPVLYWRSIIRLSLYAVPLYFGGRDRAFTVGILLVYARCWRLFAYPKHLTQLAWPQ